MAKTFQEYIQSRAEKDHTLLQCAYRELPTFFSFKSNYNNILHTVGKPGAIISMPVKTILGAAVVSLSRAGEAYKKIKQTEPQTLASLPEFPWESVKRLRDTMTGVYDERTGPMAEDKQKAKRVDKELTKLHAFTQTLDMRHNPHRSKLYRELSEGLDWFERLSQLAAGYDQADNIAVYGSARAEDILGENAVNIAMFLPVMIILEGTRCGANATMDCFKRTSSLCKATYPGLFDDKEFTRLQKIRNRWAHFDDFFLETRIITDPYEIKDCLKSMEKLRKRFPESVATYKEEVAPHVEQMANDYERRILGRVPMSAEKLKNMDCFVSWITKNFQGLDQLQDSAISAAGQTLQFAPAEVREIFDYVYSHKTDLNSPKDLLRNLPGKGQVLQIGVRSFVESMGNGLPSRTMGAGHYQPNNEATTPYRR